MSETNYIWQPRWYYILRNKTSGKKYVGQTVRRNMDEYCGSGGYWMKHCKKHGGWNRTNIEVVWREWFVCEDTTKSFLKNFEARNPGYYSLDCKEWANQVPENTQDSAFAGSKGQTKETCARLAKISKALSKTMTGRTKETCARLAKQTKTMSKNWAGQTKENCDRVAKAAKTMSKTRTGQTKENCNRVAKAAKTRTKLLKTPVICIETSQTFHTCPEIVDWLKIQGHKKAQGNNAVLCARGQVKQAYSFTWKFA